jgi:hypothetical protein
MSRISCLFSLKFSRLGLLIFLLSCHLFLPAAQAQTPCTDNEIWAVFPTSGELGNVNDQLLTRSGPTTANDGSRAFSMRWQGAAASRSVSVTVTEYSSPKEAAQKIHSYGVSNNGQVKPGMIKLGFGDEGYKTDDTRRPYYLVHKGQFALSYYTSYPGRSGGSPGNQDPTVQKIIQKIAALPCLGPIVNPPPPGNSCPKVSLNASPTKASPSQTIKLTANASDPDQDTLTLTWSVTDARGKQVNVPWNGKTRTGSGTVTDTVSWQNPPAGQYDVHISVSDGKCGKTQKRATTVFVAADKTFTVKITTDKPYYLKGETVNCTITVKDETGSPVPNADLMAVGTRLKSGRRTVLLDDYTDPSGQKGFSFVWGGNGAAAGIPEGKLKIEVKAEHLGRTTWKGYTPGYGSVVISGCGDGHRECSDPKSYCENCFNCPEDSPCKTGEICDPLNKKSDKQTGCGPKTAIIFTTNKDPAYTWRHQLFARDEQTYIRDKFQKEGYDVIPVSLKGKMVYLPKRGEKVWVPDKEQMARYLAMPSTKAIAFFGHGGSLQDETNGVWKPSLGGDNTAIHLHLSVLNQTALNYQKLYKMDYMKARSKAEGELTDPKWNCGLNMAYIHACHSLDDNSLMEFLVRKGDTYWGDEGILFGINDLVEKKRP